MTTFESIREDEEFNSVEQKTLDGRKVEHRNYTIEAMDPWGFWFVKAPKGYLPEKLSGAFTSQDRAREAIDQHLSTKKPSDNSVQQAKKKYDERMKNDDNLTRDTDRDGTTRV